MTPRCIEVLPITKNSKKGIRCLKEDGLVFIEDHDAAYKAHCNSV
jgi:hypothetical protein